MKADYFGKLPEPEFGGIIGIRGRLASLNSWHDSSEAEILVGYIYHTQQKELF